MKHSLAVLGLFLALNFALHSGAMGKLCDVNAIFNTAKAMCKLNPFKLHCAEIDQGVDSFAQLVLARQSKLCKIPGPIWLLCKYCEVTEPESSREQTDATNGTAAAGNETAAAGASRSLPIAIPPIIPGL
ncbi:uncharacterized protein LOC117580983 [Drosophila guanche]|uniref:Uncharacterized protein n=1 Tax=Drosophila guanche TaxID=7266 RepID=A0A3B0JYC1_DROGU|nr:uncharacterized protein LOC117580983 [Drosophila guanche]SPP78366.1 Hypothetical predicted protein [Drosophila guanche]